MGLCVWCAMVPVMCVCTGRSRIYKGGGGGGGGGGGV